MAEIKVTLLNSGIPALLQSSSDFFGVNLDSFRIGDAFNFVVDPEETNPRGNITYTAGKEALKLKLFDADKSLRVSLIVPEQYDNIDIGNIVIYALYKGAIKPFVSLVLSELITKRNPTSEITDQNFKYPGNRLVINITIRYVSAGELESDYQINIVTPNYANLAYFGKDVDLPIVIENPHSQFIVNRMASLNNMPAFVTKDSENTNYYASPLFQNIASPKFGVLNSFEADKFNGDRITWVWGQTYTTPEDAFRGIVGGLSYTDSDTAVVIGGLPYEEN